MKTSDRDYKDNVASARKARQGLERRNGDGSFSTHIMRHEIDGDRWLAFPTLFPGFDTGKDTLEWKEFTEEEDPYGKKALEEAYKRNEVWVFTDQDSAKKFAEGDWKPLEQQKLQGFKDSKVFDMIKDK